MRFPDSVSAAYDHLRTPVFLASDTGESLLATGFCSPERPDRDAVGLYPVTNQHGAHRLRPFHRQALVVLGGPTLSVCPSITTICARDFLSRRSTI
jgi:hypothetical protein